MVSEAGRRPPGPKTIQGHQVVKFLNLSGALGVRLRGSNLAREKITCRGAAKILHSRILKRSGSVEATVFPVTSPLRPLQGPRTAHRCAVRAFALDQPLLASAHRDRLNLAGNDGQRMLGSKK